MNDVAGSFAMYRFLLSLTLVFGGVAAIWFGYRLFSSGAGTAKALEKLDFKNKDVKISAAGMSVGAVLMLTSVIWSYFAYSSFPHLEMAGENLKIAGSPSIRPDIQAVIGAPVYTPSHEKVGTISNIMLNGNAEATGIVIRADDSSSPKQVLLPPSLLEFRLKDAQVNAVVKMDKPAFEKVPTVASQASRPEG